MIRTLLILLLLSSPAWGFGDASEELCDSPGSGITCLCSLPMTFDSGFQDSNFTLDPDVVGKKACNGPPEAMRRTAGAELDFVLASSLPDDVEIAVGGSGFQMRIGADQPTVKNGWHVEHGGYVFTDKTWCTRHYEYLGSGFACNGACNPKWPRFGDNSPSLGHPGYQGSLTNAISVDRPRFSLGAFNQPSPVADWRCKTGADFGCDIGKLRDAQHDSGYGVLLSYENHLQSGFARYEYCLDHNLTEAQVTGASDSLNSLHPGAALTYPGADFIYMRVKVTMVSGPHAGNVSYMGPGYKGQADTTGARTSNPNDDQTRLFSSAQGSTGCPDLVCEMDFDNIWLSYFISMSNTNADRASYWPGGAAEVEGGTPIIPTPTESEGVVFDGVNLTMVMP